VVLNHKHILMIWTWPEPWADEQEWSDGYTRKASGVPRQPALYSAQRYRMSLHQVRTILSSLPNPGESKYLAIYGAESPPEAADALAKRVGKIGARGTAASISRYFDAITEPVLKQGGEIPDEPRTVLVVQMWPDPKEDEAAWNAGCDELLKEVVELDGIYTGQRFRMSEFQAATIVSGGPMPDEPKYVNLYSVRSAEHASEVLADQAARRGAHGTLATRVRYYDAITEQYVGDGYEEHVLRA